MLSFIKNFHMSLFYATSLLQTCRYAIFFLQIGGSCETHISVREKLYKTDARDASTQQYLFIYNLFKHIHNIRIVYGTASPLMLPVLFVLSRLLLLLLLFQYQYLFKARVYLCTPKILELFMGLLIHNDYTRIRAFQVAVVVLVVVYLFIIF